MIHGDPETRQRSWHFLTNHAHVLLSVVQEPTIRVNVRIIAVRTKGIILRE